MFDNSLSYACHLIGFPVAVLGILFDSSDFELYLPAEKLARLQETLQHAVGKSVMLIQDKSWNLS